MGIQDKQVSGFRALTSEELPQVSGGNYHDEPPGIGTGEQHEPMSVLLASWGIESDALAADGTIVVNGSTSADLYLGSGNTVGNADGLLDRQDVLNSIADRIAQESNEEVLAFLSGLEDRFTAGEGDTIKAILTFTKTGEGVDPNDPNRGPIDANQDGVDDLDGTIIVTAITPGADAALLGEAEALVDFWKYHLLVVGAGALTAQSAAFSAMLTAMFGSEKVAAMAFAAGGIVGEEALTQWLIDQKHQQLREEYKGQVTVGNDGVPTYHFPELSQAELEAFGDGLVD